MQHHGYTLCSNGYTSVTLGWQMAASSRYKSLNVGESGSFLVAAKENKCAEYHHKQSEYQA